MIAKSQLMKSERSLVEAARAGAELQGDIEVRAEMIRDLMLGRHGQQLDPVLAEIAIRAGQAAWWYSLSGRC